MCKPNFEVEWSDSAKVDFREKVLNERQFWQIIDTMVEMMIDPNEGSYPAPNGRYRSTGKYELLYSVCNLVCTIKRIYWKDRIY